MLHSYYCSHLDLRIVPDVLNLSPSGEKIDVFFRFNDAKHMIVLVERNETL